MQATGLALPGSDLDVVILGISGVPAPRPAEGYSVRAREQVIKVLRKVEGALRKHRLIHNAQLIHAKVPIIKTEMRRWDGDNQRTINLQVDISVGALNGACAVNYITKQVSECFKWSVSGSWARQMDSCWCWRDV